MAVDALLVHLDRGEAETIVLATEVNAHLVLMDDADGRKAARSMGLRVTGTVGLLLRAAKDGRLDFREAMDRLLAQGFRLSEREYREILKLL